MSKTKSVPTCDFDGCNDSRAWKSPGWCRFCGFHRSRATIGGFLSELYTGMSRRVRGLSTKRPDLYKGLPILPRDVFVNWAKNHPEFLSSYKRWVTNDFNRKLTPSINRMNSNKGYVLGNIEWMTNSQNCGLSGEVRKMKTKKAIYDLLGVNK